MQSFRWILVGFGLFGLVPASAKLRVLATTQDLAWLAAAVGADRVEAEAIVKGYQDPHFVEPRPSYIRKAQKADLVVFVGLDLEVAWLPALLESARNPKILPGGRGYLDASRGCEILEVPQTQVTRAMGDVHPFGNPHYWLDPKNGLAIAASLRDKLSELDPQGSSVYRANFARLEKRLAEAERRWDEIARPLKGVKVVTYHRTWPNFAKRFGLEVVNYLEPKPGVPPSPSHLDALVRQMKAEGVPLILLEPWFSRSEAERVAKQTGAKVVAVFPSIGGDPEIRDYYELFEVNLRRLIQALKPQP